MSAFLDPIQSRRHLLDLVRPPVGYKLDAAIGTTFSLELPVLLAVLIEMAQQTQEETDTPETEMDDEQGNQGGLSPLIAVKKLLERVRVLVHRGGIKSMKKHNEATSILDGFIEEIHMKDLAAFHPKVWVLRFKHKERGSSMHRLVCMSRNLTSSQQAEIGVVMEESPGQRGYAMTELAGFWSTLYPQAEGPIGEMIQEIGEIRFLSPVEKWKPSFIYQAAGSSSLMDHLPKKSEKTLVVSPFLHKDMLQKLDSYRSAGGGETTLFSMESELRKIPADHLNSLLPDNVFAFDQVQWEEGAEDGGLLHAKIFFSENPKTKELFIGSANWTKHAWQGRNWEAMIKLTGPGDDTSVQIENLKNSLKHMGATPFQHRELTQSERDQIEADKKASNCISVIAGLTFNGEWRTEDGSLALYVNIKGDPSPVAAYTGTFRTFPYGKFRDISDLASGKTLVFELRSDLDRTKFLEFDIQVNVGLATVSKKCLMLMHIPETQEQREKRIDDVIASYLTDPDKFWDALMNILTDNELQKGNENQRNPLFSEHDQEREADVFPFSELNLELLLKACYDDEDKVKAINSIVDGVKAAQKQERQREWDRIESFIELWNLIVSAREGVNHGTKTVSKKVR